MSEPSSVTRNPAPAADLPPSSPAQLKSTARAREFSKQWFESLRRQVFEERQPFAICGAETPHEIFEVFDVPTVTSQWWSGVVSAKRMSGKYFDWMNRKGYHEGLGGYSALSLITLIADVPDPPWGGLPKPALLCMNARDQSSEWSFSLASERLGVPYVRIDVPASTRFYPKWWEMSQWWWEDLYESHRLDFMVENFRRLIAKLEEITGKKFDVDRLRELLTRVNEQEEYFGEARDLVCSAPKCPVRLSEQMSNTMTAQWHRGSDWAVNHGREFRDEVKARVDAGQGVIDDERIRLMWVGVGLWQNTAFYSAFEESHKAVFVRSMYMSIAADGYIKYGLKDPVRALAARYLNLGEQMHIGPWGSEYALHEGRIHRVNGSVHIVTSNITSIYVGAIAQRKALERAGIPVLELHVDPNDTRQWNDAEMRQRVARFIDDRVVPGLG
jgi:hypothetical protein